MKVYIATDHAGFALKENLASHLHQLGYEVVDMGAQQFVSDDDYPMYMVPCAQKVAQENADGKSDVFGIIIGGSGQGEAMAANRIKGARAGVYYSVNLDIIRLARQHNDANILSLGARFITEDEAKDAVRTFLETPFSGEERHVRRIAELEAL